MSVYVELSQDNVVTSVILADSKPEFGNFLNVDGIRLFPQVGFVFNGEGFINPSPETLWPKDLAGLPITYHTYHPVNKVYTGSYSDEMPNSTPVFPPFAGIGYVPVWTDNDHWVIKPINEVEL